RAHEMPRKLGTQECRCTLFRLPGIRCARGRACAQSVIVREPESGDPFGSSAATVAADRVPDSGDARLRRIWRQRLAAVPARCAHRRMPVGPVVATGTSAWRHASTIVAMQPMTEAARISAPSHRTGCRNHFPPPRCVLTSSCRSRLGIDPGSDERDILLSEPDAERRHYAVAPVLDGFDDSLYVAVAMQPDVVGQVRRAERGVPLAVGTVASGADRECR